MYCMQLPTQESDRGWTGTMDKNSFLRVQKEENKISAKYERGLFKDVLISLRENKLAMCCSEILLLILLACVIVFILTVTGWTVKPIRS